MRLNKIMALGLMSAMALVSCQQTVTPTGDAAVGFASAEFESGLGSEYIYVPIVTTGETTVYPIKVNIEVGEYTGDYAAKEDVDFIVRHDDLEAFISLMSAKLEDPRESYSDFVQGVLQLAGILLFL